MRLALAIVLALSLAGVAAPLAAETSELGTDETRAGMCDDFEGLSFVFCVALCEARECDRQDPGDERCGLLARGFSRVSGGARPPCTSTPASGSI
jgi:hypothetical protein